jgi:two-component system sensor histidine kinase HydH
VGAAVPGAALSVAPSAERLLLQQLAARLAWIVGLRIAFVTLLFGLTASFYLRRGFEIATYSNRVLFVALTVTYVWAALYFAALRRRKWLVELTFLELIVDQATWTALIYVTGGATSGATALYGLTCLAGAISIGPRGPFVAALSAVLFYLMLCGAFIAGVIDVPGDQLPTSYVTAFGEIIYPFFINLLVLIVVTVLAEYLAERLRLTGGRLAEATQRAEDAERLAALGRIAAGLAHEIRNPLGSILGSVQLLRTAEGLGVEARHLCGIVERETGRLNDLVDDMLQLARPRRPVLGEVDVGRTAREVVALASQSGRGTDVDVRYDGPDDGESLALQADPGQLRQVMWNLVRNAVQASSPGARVTVRVAPDTTRSKSRGARRALLEVHDDGPGIGADARERLFDAFFTTRSSGLGIGLAVVKRIVDEHGWAIEVESKEGRGATFRVRMG